MKRYFSVKVKTFQITEKGKRKQVTEQYLVQASDVIGAEKILWSNYGGAGDEEIASISETKILDVFNPEND